MNIFPWIAKQHFRYLIPDFEYRKFNKHLCRQLLYLFFILDTFLNKHTNFLMIVINIIMLKYLTFSIVTNNFKKLLRLPPQLFINLFHDLNINRKVWYINIQFNLFNKLDEINLFRGDDITNVSVYDDVLIVNFKLLELDQTVFLVDCVLLDLLEEYARVGFTQVEILTSDHTLVSLRVLNSYLTTCVVLLLVTVQLKVLIRLCDLQHLCRVNNTWLWSTKLPIICQIQKLKKVQITHCPYHTTFKLRRQSLL